MTTKGRRYPQKARVPALQLIVLLAASSFGLAATLPNFIGERFRGPDVQVREVEGVQERVHDGKLFLHVKDFLALLLKNNTEINIARLDVLSSADQILGAKAPFDPSVTASFNNTRSLTAQSSQIGGAPELDFLSQTTQMNYQQLLESGQTVSVGFNASRASTNSEFNFLNPSISTSTFFLVTQPLWQGRTNLQFKAPLMIARTELLITSDQTEARIADMVAAAASQYWDAVQARDNIKVQQQAYDLAQKQYERDKLSLDLGALPSLDIFQSQSQLAQRKVAVIQAQYAYRDALDGLRRLIGADLNPDTRNIEIVLEDNPVAEVAPVPPTEEAIGGALQKRPELSAVRRHQGVNDLNVRVARDSMVPRVDLQAFGGGNGLAGDQIPVTGPLGTGPTTFASSGLGEALRQTFAFQSPTYGFGVNVTLPVRNSSATQGLADALVNRARDRYTERQIEQQVIQQVKLATSQIQSSAAQIEAAKTARDLAQKNVEAEQQKYELGGVTAFEVLDAQTRLATVESSLLQAYVGYQKTLIAYERAVWTLLDGLGIVVEVPKVR
ncbi:MAG TPA: TolC family protein [Bryobacteraceae bacterium]|nr:TolC family protein [Bryobacteraceae bacterium]